MLKSILMVWVLAQNLALTEEAYEDYLGYRSVDEGVMSVELAAAIDRPELADRRFVTMMPRSGPQVGLRLVEGDASGHVPMQRVGWSAIELLVQDPEQLETELAGSAFRHLQGPDFLTEQKNILAMQVTGPNRELFYLTSICLLYTSPSPRDLSTSRMPSSA